MKIGILTLPLYTNYGGLLQAYALQTVLRKMGHEVWVEYRRNNKYNIKKYIWQAMVFVLSFFSSRYKRIYIPTEKENEIIGQYTNQFVLRYINKTVPIYTRNKKLLEQYGFEAYIVGSDQIWRPRYSRGLANAFLDFTKGKNVKRISYAASFGTDVWEFTEKQTKQCALLAKKFDALSVREDSGVFLCEKFFNVKAVQVLDPTLLLEKDDYIRIIKEKNIPEIDVEIFTYILDQSKEKQRIVDYISKILNWGVFTVMPKSKYEEVGSKHIADCIFAPVECWLQGFWKAKYVITDSFHGTVFSIIFNKPFIVIANKGRGLSRFTSLLNKFELKDRLIYSFEDLSKEKVCHQIDFDKVNAIRKYEILKSINFLSRNLC